MEVFNYTVNALRGMISASIGHEQRHNFQAFLMQLKESQECSSVLCSILSTKQFDGVPPQELEAIFVLALSILHDWMKQWWNKINQEQQYHIRQISSQLLSQSTDMIHGSSYCNKLAALLADLVERQYPQYWPSFIMDVKQIWLQGPAFKQEIILKTMQFVLEDCTDSDFNTQLSTKRSEEILDGLRSSQEDILDISFQYFVMNMQVVSDLNSSPQHITEAKKCIVSLLKFLQVMASIVPNASLLRQNRNFLWLAIKGLSVDGIQIESILSIEAIVDRPIAYDDLIPAVDLLYSSEKRVSLPSEPDERIQFIHSYITTIVHILTLNVESLFHDNVKMAGKADALFQDLLTCMKQPQRRIFVEITSDLLKVIKHPSAIKYKQMEIVAKMLLEAYYEKTLKPAFIADDKLDEEKWFEIEFDDREDWHSFFSSINSQMLHLASLISEKYPLIGIHFFREKFQYVADFENFLVNALSAVPTSAGNQLQFPPELRLKTLELKSHVTLLQHIFQSSFVKIVDELSSNRDNAMKLVEQLWRWEAKGIYTFRQRLRLLSQCHPIFNFHPQPLFAFIDLLFTIMKSDRQEIVASVEIANKVTNDTAAISPQLLLADSKDDAAACLSLLIQKCPTVFNQEQVLIPLLQNVAAMLQNPQTSHHSQESMRDALVVLSTYLQNPAFQRQILDLAFQELLKKIFEILAEVFQSPEVILQAIITPLSVSSTDGQSNDQKPNTGTIFLDRSNKLRVLIQGFVNSMNKVEKTAIGCFAPDQIFPTISANGSKKSKGKKGGNKDDLPSPDSNQICSSFAFTVYWNELFQHLFPAMIRFQELWSPRIVQLLSSNPSYEPVKRSIYGPSYSESLRKCKLSGGGVDDPRHAEIRGEHALKDQLYLLFSVFCKTLSVSGKQFVLHPLLMVGGNDSQLYQWMQQIVMNAVFMDNHLYSVFMKYVVESLSMSCLPMTRIRTIPVLTVVMQSINKRLTFAWNAGPGQGVAIANMEENQFYVQLYHQCNIVTTSGMCLGLTGQPQTAPQLSSDQVGMVKEAFIREVTGVIVESLSIIFGIKGDLAPVGSMSASSSNNNTEEDPVIAFLEARRNLIWSMHLGNTTENAGLLNALKTLLLQLLSVPDGATVRQALLIVNLILKKSESELPHLEGFVTSECFRIVLKNLIHMESWSQGMEWEFVEYLLEAIKTHDLNHCDSSNKHSQDNGKGNQKMDHWNGPSKGGKGQGNNNKNSGKLSICFQHLLETGATNNQEIDELRKQLLQSNAATKKNKGKQREALRDFITTLMHRIHGKETLQSAGSELAKKDPRVMDIAISSGKRDQKKKGPNKAKNHDNVGVDDLFDV